MSAKRKVENGGLEEQVWLKKGKGETGDETDGNVEDVVRTLLAAGAPQLNTLLSIQTRPEVFTQKLIPENDSVLAIYHNLKRAKDTSAPFEIEYIHPETLKSGHFFEVRIDDIGEKYRNKSKFCIGIGVRNMTSASGKNRRDFGFDIGFLQNLRTAFRLTGGDDHESIDDLNCLLTPGDLIRIDICDDGAHMSKNGKAPGKRLNAYNDKDEYKIFIGMNNRFERVTLAFNNSFSTMCEEPLNKFPKEDLRIFVTSMNEASPRYAEGVAKGGKHLLKDGMLLRRLRADGRRIINYQPGRNASSYDAKMGGPSILAEILPEDLIRNRVELSGNQLTITRKDKKEYSVIVKSLLTAHEEKFIGTSAQWFKERDRLLSSGEKYLINLPTPNGMIQANDLLIAGTKCKAVHNMIHGTLTHKVLDTDKTPAILLLGGDRSQSIGSISGAVEAYKDVCIIFFDAHFDFRDPNASQYPMAHGSTLFFLLQSHLRNAITEWNAMDKLTQNKLPLIRRAIEFLNSTREGRQYWEGLQQPSVGYRGFNWLQEAEKVDPARMAFLGMRETKMEAGSSLGSPLTDLFAHLLHLENGIYPSYRIRSDGVTKIFQELIDQFRKTFSDEYLRQKDAADSKGRWIPPIMVSWDADSIDPNDLPCTIYQEANGLSSEECLAFCDEIASTEKLVLMEVIEFNPDLWKDYRDEPIVLTIKDFEAGPFGRSPREPTDKSKHRLDLQLSTSLLQDMVTTALNPNPVCVES